MQRCTSNVNTSKRLGTSSMRAFMLDTTSRLHEIVQVVCLYYIASSVTKRLSSSRPRFHESLLMMISALIYHQPFSANLPIANYGLASCCVCHRAFPQADPQTSMSVELIGGRRLEGECHGSSLLALGLWTTWVVGRLSIRLELCLHCHIGDPSDEVLAAQCSFNCSDAAGCWLPLHMTWSRMISRILATLLASPYPSAYLISVPSYHI